MKTRKLLSIVILFILSACAPTEIVQEPADQAGFPQARLIFEAGSTNIFKFTDGDRECYVAEKFFHDGGTSIWCEQ
jgi:hypothetical protein